MINVNMEKMMKLMNDVFSYLASSIREPGTYSSQSKVNTKGLASSSSSRPTSSANVRKLNAVVSLRCSREINNQVGYSKKQADMLTLSSKIHLLPLFFSA